MTDQLYSYGQYKAVAVLKEGIHSTRKMPLGYWFDKGNHRYRYAKFTGSTPVGRGFGQYGLSGETLSGSAYFGSMFSGAHRGFESGDNCLHIYSMAGLSAEAYVGGTLDIISGSGSPFSYRIKDYEVGSAGLKTKLWIEDGLQSTLDSTTVARITENPYWNVQYWSAASGDVPWKPRGFLPITDASGSNTSGYGFLVTRGRAVPTTSTVLSYGRPVYMGEAAGTVVRQSTTNSGIAPVGVACWECAAADHVSVDVLLE